MPQPRELKLWAVDDIHDHAQLRRGGPPEVQLPCRRDTGPTLPCRMPADVDVPGGSRSPAVRALAAAAGRCRPPGVGCTDSNPPSFGASRSDHHGSRPVDDRLLSVRAVWVCIPSSCRSARLRAQIVPPLQPPTPTRSGVSTVCSSVSRMSNIASPGFLHLDHQGVHHPGHGVVVRHLWCRLPALRHPQSPSYRAAATAQATAIASGR